MPRASSLTPAIATTLRRCIPEAHWDGATCSYHYAGESSDVKRCGVQLLGNTVLLQAPVRKPMSGDCPRTALRSGLGLGSFRLVT